MKKIFLFIILVLSMGTISPWIYAADMEAVLDSSDGSSKFSIQDSTLPTAVEVMAVDSDGNIVTKGCVRIDSGGTECTTAENLIVDGNVGIGDTDPASALSVGSGDLFQVNSSGDVIRIEGVTYNWPGSQGASSTVLSNDGSGNLSWSSMVESSVSDDSLNWDKFIDAMTLDATTTINMDTNTADLNFDGNTFFIDSSANRIGIGTDTPDFSLHVLNASSENILIEGASAAVNLKDNNATTSRQVVQFLSSSGLFRIRGLGDNLVAQTVIGLAMDLSNGNIGIGDITPNSLLTVGDGDVFQVNSSGDLIRIEGITYNWPGSQGGSSTVLTNDGSGNLSWSSMAESSISDDSLDWNKFSDAMTLDATTTIDMDTNTADLNFDSNTFFIDSSANNVGIGTTSPQALFHVLSGGTGAAPSASATRMILQNNANTSDGVILSLISGNASNAQIVFGDAEDDTEGRVTYRNDLDAMSFFVNDAERVRIDSSGHLGIGTTGPATRLEVDTGTATETTALVTLDNAAGDMQVFVSDGSPENAITGSPGDLAIDVTSATAALYVKETGSATNTGWNVLESGGMVSLDEAYDAGGSGAGRAITVDSSAVQLTGSNASDETLEVTREISTTNAVIDAVMVGSSSSGIPAAGLGTGVVFQVEDAGGSEEQASIDVVLDDVTNTTEDATITFSVNQNGTISEIMRIDGSDGYVGIGTTSPTQKFHVEQTTTTTPIATFRNSADASNVVLSSAGANAALVQGGGGDTLTLAANNGTDHFHIDTNGNIGIGTTTPSVLLEIDAETSTATDAIFEITTDVSSNENIVFQIEADGEAFSDVGFTTPATDVAESFPIRGQAEPGDVVIIDTSADETLTLSAKAYDQLVAGVISTKPGIRLGVHEVYVALAGRVPVKVVGQVQRGDLLVTSNKPGKAMRCEHYDRCSGAILGKSLTNMKDGKVIALISLQ